MTLRLLSPSLPSFETLGGVAMFCLFMGTALARMPPSAVGSKATGYVGATLRGIRSWTSLAFLATPATGGSIPSEANEILTPGSTPMPKIVHRVVGPGDVKSRVIVVGDIHGCCDELRDLLAACKYTPQDDSVVLVGDLVNKGPKSAEVVRYARESGFLVVRGNHDDAALEAYFRVGRFQKSRPPAYDYVDRFSKEDVEWLSELPYTLSLPHLNAVVVHAGLLPGLPLSKQKAYDMSKLRNVIEKGRGVYEGKESVSTGEGWVLHWKGPQHVYFGHDAKRGLQLAEYATGLDTGCCYGRCLTAAILPSRERVQVPARTTYVKVAED